MKRTLLFNLAMTSLVLTGCRSQEVAEETVSQETMEQVVHHNSLLTKSTNKHGVESFDKLTVADYREAILDGMKKQKAEVQAIIDNNDTPTFRNTIVALDQSGKDLDRASQTFGPLSESNSTAETRKLEQELSPLSAAHNDDIYMNPALFAKVKKVHDDIDSTTLNKEERKVLDNIYKRFVRNGANLSDADKEKLRKLNVEISELQTKFGQNLLHDTNNRYVTVDNLSELAGLPQGNIDRAAAMATEQGLPGKWMFNMQRMSCNPVLQYCKNRELRKKVYLAYVNRCNNDDEWDNKKICAEIIRKRMERAQLMGFKTCADQILDTRMAKKPKAVYDLLDQVWVPAVKKANEEIADIKVEMQKDGINEEPEGWDYRYYSERARKVKFNFDEKEISEYLELNNVLKGVFWTANKLYGVTFKNVTNELPAYEETAQAWEVYDKDSTFLAVFYSDYMPRDGKGAGAWMTEFRDQAYENGKRIEPVVVNVCSFTPPTKDTPSLLTPDDVHTMFHEFGHALHYMMHDVHYKSVYNVERDLIELPSQLNEHWAFEPQVLAIYAKHYKTGEPLPQALLDKYLASSKYGQGFENTELMAASYTDMDVHSLTSVPEDFNVTKFEDEKLAERGIPRQIAPRYRMTNFSHTMGGGYVAGYYCYTWAAVLDCDAFEAFKETGDIFNPEMSAKFRKYVLAPGGIDDGMTMYINFRGGYPKVDALLRDRGLK